jgi:hypothetical protein
MIIVGGCAPLKPSRSMGGILLGLFSLVAVWGIGRWPPAESGTPGPQPLRAGSRVPAFRALSSRGPVRFPPVGHASVVFFYEADT